MYFVLGNDIHCTLIMAANPAVKVSTAACCPGDVAWADGCMVGVQMCADALNILQKPQLHTCGFS